MAEKKLPAIDIYDPRVLKHIITRSPIQNGFLTDRDGATICMACHTGMICYGIIDTPNNHLADVWHCPKCDESHTMTTAQFIASFQESD